MKYKEYKIYIKTNKKHKMSGKPKKYAQKVDNGKF